MSAPYHNMCIVFIVLFFLNSMAMGQHTEWISFQKCSKLTQIRGLGVDQLGNVYSVATFDEELRIGSSDVFKDTFGAYAPWRNYVFTKHNPQGKLLFTSLIETRGGNSHTAEVRKMHVTSEGRIVVHLICGRDFYYVDNERNETKLRSKYNQTSVLVISDQGVLIKHVSVPIKDCSQITDDGQGGIFILARMNFRNSILKNQLFKINEGANDPVEVSFPQGRIQKIHCFRGKLWIATLEQGKRRGYYHSHKVGMYSSKLSDLVDFSEAEKIQIGLNHFCDLQFVTLGQKLKLVLLSKALLEFTLSSRKLKIKKGETGLLVLSTSLELEQYTSFNGLSHGLRLVGLNDGSFILQFSVLDALVINGKTEHVFPRHTNFVYELVHVKLDRSLKFQWVINGGGTATNYHIPEMVLSTDEKQLFVGSDLINYGRLDFGYFENDWRSSYYIRKIEL